MKTIKFLRWMRLMILILALSACDKIIAQSPAPGITSQPTTSPGATSPAGKNAASTAQIFPEGCVYFNEDEILANMQKGTNITEEYLLEQGRLLQEALDKGEELPEPFVIGDSLAGQIGQAMRVNDHMITLERVELVGDKLISSFMIEHQGCLDISIRATDHFIAMDAQGNLLEQIPTNCGRPSIDGNLAYGEQRTGDICWKSTATPVFSIVYRSPSLLNVTWEIK